MRDVRVAYSLEQCWHRVPGGTAVSALEVARELEARDDLELLPFAGRHKTPPGMPLGLSSPLHTLPFGRPLLYETWLRYQWPKVESVCSDIDLVHGTTIIPPATTRPITVTIHDLAFLRYPEFFTKRGNRVFRKSLEILKQRRCIVMCSSTATVRDCIDAGFDQSLLRLVPLGVRMETPTEADLARVRATYDLPDTFVLFVGTMEPRKNLPRLVEAMNRMPERLQLVIAGVEGWGENPVVPHDMPVSFLGSIHQHNLAALYKAATVLAYPSLWEGFGLPILEAMAQGTAVVTSQGTSTEEVAGGAAVIVDPSDVTSIVTGIREALRRVDELAVAGKERVQQMTWQHTAQMTRDVYEEVVEDATRGNVGRS
jgi:glycosyltransferase involved in cell wall biosynthesis